MVDDLKYTLANAMGWSKSSKITPLILVCAQNETVMKNRRKERVVLFIIIKKTSSRFEVMKFKYKLFL
jgi:hypothetical protein